MSEKMSNLAPEPKPSFSDFGRIYSEAAANQRHVETLCLATMTATITFLGIISAGYLIAYRDSGQVSAQHFFGHLEYYFFQTGERVCLRNIFFK